MNSVNNLNENRMKTVLVAVNAKYIHTNPAVRSVAACIRQRGFPVTIVETTINNNAGSILMELYQHKAQVYLFSCYIWNISLIRRLASDLRRTLGNHILIGAAGPQVTFRHGDFLIRNPSFDFVLPGEGEETTPALLEALETHKGFSGCEGVVFRENGGFTFMPPASLPPMDSLPFPYYDLDELSGRILYYESMRGCPFSCAYCMSATSRGVRTRSLPLVFADLQRFLDAGVRQVKFVDRTFNAVKEHATSIWEYLIRHDNGLTNFHFEMAGELLDEDMLSLLGAARPGLFQFEIGVQSVNEKTLEQIHRPFHFEKLASRVSALRKQGNIHIHLDLIAGLPHEGFESFAHSFDKVFALYPHQLQLGFLKVLPGSELEARAREYGIVCSETPPFEVLRTNWISFEELWELHGVADMVDTYHNSGRFSHIMGYILSHFDSPFSCFQALASYFRQKGHHNSPLSKTGYYELLEGFMKHRGIPVTERARWLCKLDVISVEKPRKLPQWAEVDLSGEYRHQILEFLGNQKLVEQHLPEHVGTEPKHLRRIVHLEVLPFSPVTNENSPCAILRDYRTGTAVWLPVCAKTGKIG